MSRRQRLMWVYRIAGPVGALVLAALTLIFFRKPNVAPYAEPARFAALLVMTVVIMGWSFGQFWGVDREANVIHSQQVNAFALPGGKIAVFTGILPVAQDDDQLATVLSHEIAHVLAHHASERLAREQSGRVGFLSRKAYDRGQESEADHIGVFLMTFAGYDPEEAIRFWQRMQRISEDRGQVPEFLSDHPSDAHRLRALEGWVPRARLAKRAFDEGRIAPERGR